MSNQTLPLLLAVLTLGAIESFAQNESETEVVEVSTETVSEETVSPEAGPSKESEEAADTNVTDEAGSETTVVEAVVEEVIPVSPQDALVAVRGQARAGLGVMIKVQEREVILTSLSALDGSRDIHVNMADGTKIPVGSVVAFNGTDLAFITIEGETDELPIYEWDPEVTLNAGDSVTIINPRRTIEGKIDGGAPGRYAMRRPEGRIFAGAPVVRDGELVGVVSPSRFLGISSGSKSGRTEIVPFGIANLPPKAKWEVIDLRKMSFEREAINQWTNTLSGLGAFFGVSRSTGEVEMQRLVAAQKRLKEGLARSDQDVERDNARKRFVFSVRSAVGALVTDLQQAQTGYYSYFDPEIDELIKLYRPIGAKLEALEANPRTADSYAR